MPAAARALALQERGQDLRHGSERAGGEIGDLEGGIRGGGVLQHAGPAEVVEVVPCACGVTPFGAKAGDRAVDDRRGNVVRGNAEPCGDARPEALEHDVRARTQGARELRVGGEVAQHRLLASTKREIPGGRRLPHRITVRCLDAHHPGPET